MEKNTEGAHTDAHRTTFKRTSINHVWRLGVKGQCHVALSTQAESDEENNAGFKEFVQKIIERAVGAESVCASINKTHNTQKTPQTY
jgi:hypothetical protein